MHPYKRNKMKVMTSNGSFAYNFIVLSFHEQITNILTPLELMKIDEIEWDNHKLQ